MQKVFLTIPEQIARLRGRGLEIPDERFAAQDRGREIFQYPRAPGGGAFHWNFADCAGYLLIVRLAVELAVFRLWALRLVEMDFSIFKNQFSVVGGDFQPVGAGQLAG